MKLREVVMRVMSKEYGGYQAAEIVGIAGRFELWPLRCSWMTAQSSDGFRKHIED
jgi:hypothetical protein